jgi:hypothetical protein
MTWATLAVAIYVRRQGSSDIDVEELVPPSRASSMKGEVR